MEIIDPENKKRKRKCGTVLKKAKPEGRYLVD